MFCVVNLSEMINNAESSADEIGLNNQLAAEECTVSHSFKHMSCDKRLIKKGYSKSVQSVGKQEASSQLVRGLKPDQDCSFALAINELIVMLCFSF